MIEALPLAKSSSRMAFPHSAQWTILLPTRSSGPVQSYYEIWHWQQAAAAVLASSAIQSDTSSAGCVHQDFEPTAGEGVMSTSLLPIVVFLVAVEGQDEQAAALGNWESALKSARTISAKVAVSVTLTFTEKDKPPSVILDQETHADLHLSQGNHYHLLLQEVSFSRLQGVRQAVSELKKELISDGEKTCFSWPEVSGTPVVWLKQETPKEWNESVVRALGIFDVRRGFGVQALHDDRRIPKEGTWAIPDPLGSPSEIRPLGREKIGEREALVMEYSVILDPWHARPKPRTYRVTLWLDPTSFLPLKRRKVEAHGSFESLTTEVFESLELDGKVPAGVFALPKDSAVPAAPASSPADLEMAAQITKALGLLESDNVDERDSAVGQLGRMGHRALRWLEPRLNAGDLELRGRVASAIRRILDTDPLFLAAPPKRLVTLHMKETAVQAVFAEAFRAFPSQPVLESRIGGDIPPVLTLDLQNASYWETVLAFKKAAKAYFNPDELQYTGYPPYDRMEFSTPDGPFLPAAWMKEDHDQAILRIRILIEPGWLPIDATFRLTSIKDQTGKDLSPLFVNQLKNDLQAQQFGEDREFLAPIHLFSGTHFLVASLKADPTKLPQGVRITVEGSAKVRLPAEVESAEFHFKDFKGDEEQRLGDHRIRMTNLKSTGKEIQYGAGSWGPKEWKAPVDKPYQKNIWLVVADNQGHSVYNGSEAYTSSGTRTSGANWPFKTAPTRLSYIRPMEAETREVLIQIEGIELLKD
jgi:hypothetical protein